MISMMQLGISGLLAMIAYFGFTYVFGLPQVILHIDLSRLRKGRKS